MGEKTNETESRLLGDSKEENEKVSETTESKVPDQENNNLSETSEKIQLDQENRNVSDTTKIILLNQEPKGNPQVPKKQQLKPRKKIVKAGTKKLIQNQKKKMNESIPEKIKSDQVNDENKEKLEGSGMSLQEEGRKNEEVLQDVQQDKENNNTHDGSERGQQEEKKMTESTENNQSNQIKKELDGCQKNDLHENGKCQPDKSKKEKLDRSQKSQQKEKKKKKQSLQRGRKNEMNRDKCVLPDVDQKNEFNKENHVLSERNQNKGKGKDRPAGIIFMCSSKTKPDCFRYQVMGVSMGKKEVVLSIKPGMKLFLYDFDLKLLYGIYRASSSGGTKLEPAAFGGAFPAQVRFEIHKDCFPLPESVFRKAIKENYDKKNKFKTELTAQQVRKLTVLFRPADIRSHAHIITPKKEKPRDRKPRKKAVDARTHSYGDRYGRESYLMNVSGGSNVRRDVASTRREELPHESFLSEQEYRTYGLHGKPRNQTPPRHAPVDSYPRDHEELPRESFLSEQEYRTYGLHGKLRNPTPPRHAPVDSYPRDHEELPRESFLSEQEYRTYGLHGKPRNPTPPRHSPVDSYPRDHEELPRESFLSEQEYRTYGLHGKPRNPTPPRHAPVDSYPRDHEELPHESFLSEQEYRTYGLHGKPQNPTPPRHAPVDSYPRDHEHELHLRYKPAPRLHREIVPAHDSSRYDPMLNGREYSSYALSAPLESQFSTPLVTPDALDPYSNDPYPVSQVHALSTDPYGRSVRTEEVYPRSHHYLKGGRETYLPEADHARREIGLGERSYSAYTSDHFPVYRQRHYPNSAASTSAPVSSRYTFAGPSSSRC